MLSVKVHIIKFSYAPLQSNEFYHILSCNKIPKLYELFKFDPRNY